MDDFSLCDYCCMSKIHQLPFQASTSEYTAPLQLILSNFWCLALVHVAFGFRYYVSFIDAYSSYTSIYLLGTKSQVFQAFV